MSWDGRLIGAAPEISRGASGALDELCVTFRPCILGGKSAPPLTGLNEDFLPEGIVLDLLRVERTDGGILARYRVRRQTSRTSRTSPK
jgi:riboflavin biosynthesis pyrimidine reductase